MLLVSKIKKLLFIAIGAFFQLAVEGFFALGAVFYGGYAAIGAIFGAVGAFFELHVFGGAEVRIVEDEPVDIFYLRIISEIFSLDN